MATIVNMIRDEDLPKYSGELLQVRRTLRALFKQAERGKDK